MCGGQYTCRQFRDLRANIRLNRRTTAVVDTETTALRKKRRQDTTTVTSTKTKLEVRIFSCVHGYTLFSLLFPLPWPVPQTVQEKAIRVHSNIKSYPSKNKKIRKLQILAQGVNQGEDIFAH